MERSLADRFWNEDCITGCQKRIPDDAVDLIITDPPYGINGDTLHKHYNRKESFVLDGYEEIPQEQYAEFSRAWIQQAERILRPGGSLYIVSGWTNLRDILNALAQTRLREVNHLIWKYNFGVYTRNKYVTSHYHILYWVKPGGKPVFHTNCRYGPMERNEEGGALNYLDREDVWIINREYKPGKVKNKNELPHALLAKIMQYSSHEGDLVCDLFLGGFSTAKVAKGLRRQTCGFEISQTAFEHHLNEYCALQPGWLMETLRRPASESCARQHKRWTQADLDLLRERYDVLYNGNGNKTKCIAALCKEFGRGRFAIANALKRVGR